MRLQILSWFFLYMRLPSCVCPHVLLILQILKTFWDGAIRVVSTHLVFFHVTCLLDVLTDRYHHDLVDWSGKLQIKRQRICYTTISRVPVLLLYLSQVYDSCYPICWCVWAFDFAICLRTFRLEFSRSSVLFVILYYFLKLMTICLWPDGVTIWQGSIVLCLCSSTFIFLYICYGDCYLSLYPGVV